MTRRLNLTRFEIILIFFAALGFLYLVVAFPLDPITFIYQEI
jgi:hypothetical protein